MTKWMLTLGCVAIATAVVFVDAADPPKPEAKKNSVMQRKLKHSQSILEGLAMNDFPKISAGVDGLKECAMEASWRVLTTPKYELYSNDFVRHLDELKAAAKNKNTDAATVAYVETTLTCIKCHQHVREERVGSAPVPSGIERLANR